MCEYRLPASRPSSVASSRMLVAAKPRARNRRVAVRSIWALRERRGAAVGMLG